MERPNDLSCLWATFKADIREARTRRPVLNSKAIQALRSKDADIDKDNTYQEYLSDKYTTNQQPK